jgi:hypothetical protein
MLKRINGNNKGHSPLGTPYVIRGDAIRNTNCNKGYAPYDRRYAPYKSMK